MPYEALPPPPSQHQTTFDCGFLRLRRARCTRRWAGPAAEVARASVYKYRSSLTNCSKHETASLNIEDSS